MAAAAGRKALHRSRPAHGQRSQMVAAAPRRRAGFHARQAQGASGSYGRVHEADDPVAAGRGGARPRRGGGGRAHDPARRRHHLPHRVRHQLRDRQAHLPPPRAPAAPHRPLQPLPLDPRQPVFPEQVQEGDRAAERRAGGRRDGVHPPEPRDHRRGPDDVHVRRPGAPRHAARRDGEEQGQGGFWRRWHAAGDRRVQDLLLRRPRDVGAAAHLDAHAARHAPGVARQGPHRGCPGLRRRAAVRRPPLQTHSAADDYPRDSAAVPAGDAAAADGVRGHPARRPPPAARALGLDTRAGNPP